MATTLDVGAELASPKAAIKVAASEQCIFLEERNLRILDRFLHVENFLDWSWHDCGILQCSTPAAQAPYILLMNKGSERDDTERKLLLTRCSDYMTNIFPRGFMAFTVELHLNEDDRGSCPKLETNWKYTSVGFRAKWK